MSLAVDAATAFAFSRTCEPSCVKQSLTKHSQESGHVSGPLLGGLVYDQSG